jgi:hypothetical protein
MTLARFISPPNAFIDSVMVARKPSGTRKPPALPVALPCARSSFFTNPVRRSCCCSEGSSPIPRRM